jgi:hypothetical protein
MIETYPPDEERIIYHNLAEKREREFNEETNDLKAALVGFLDFFLRHPDGSLLLPGMKRLPEAIDLHSSSDSNPNSPKRSKSPEPVSQKERATSLIQNHRKNTVVEGTLAIPDIGINTMPSGFVKDDEKQIQIPERNVLQITESLGNPKIVASEELGVGSPKKRKVGTMDIIFRLEDGPCVDTVVNPHVAQRTPLSTLSVNATLHFNDFNAIEKPVLSKGIRKSIPTRPNKPIPILPKPANYTPRITAENNIITWRRTR